MRVKPWWVPVVGAVANPEAWVRTVAVNQVRGGWRHAAVVRRYGAKVPVLASIAYSLPPCAEGKTPD